MKQNGYMVISLDFELLWGVHDHETKESFTEQTVGARKVIPKLLNLFDKYNIHVTWGIVGMLMAKDKYQLERFIPSLKPTYNNSAFSSYSHFDSLGNNEETDPFHYAQSLVLDISKHKNQEIASHTFSHYYCKSEGQTLEQFKDDLLAAQEISKFVTGKNLTSLIFPRNNYLSEYAKAASECGFKSVRSNPKSFIYNSNSIFARAFRLVDTYINICGNKCSKPHDCINTNYFEIPASRFFRKYNNRLSFLEPLKIHCIKHQMKHAAVHGQIFHLWWHPHNISRNSDVLLLQLESIFQYYYSLNTKYGFLSVTMNELYKTISK